MLSISINRNIVECKFGAKKYVYRLDGVLIETLWNVNYKLPHSDKVHQVLIETLWNVNSIAVFDLLEEAFVLIETLWNVNCILPVCVVLELPVLIETLWNVN